jgi:hypothetical protein
MFVLRGLTVNERNLLLASLEDAGRIEVLRENRDHYHVFAFIDGAKPNDSLITASMGGGPAPKAARSVAHHAKRKSATPKAKSQSAKRRAPKSSGKRRRYASYLPEALTRLAFASRDSGPPHGDSCRKARNTYRTRLAILLLRNAIDISLLCSDDSVEASRLVKEYLRQSSHAQCPELRIDFRRGTLVSFPAYNRNLR